MTFPPNPATILRPVPHTYPLMLDLTHRRIVLIGGGGVAARKVKELLASGATDICVIAPEFKAGFPDSIERRTQCYHLQDLEGADLVFAATDSSAVNDAVVRDARAMGILVNRADGSDELPGDFTTPAKFQSGSITVTVSAGSAALTAMVRDRLQERFDPAWAAMADAMKVLRPMIKASDRDGEKRAELFRALATSEAIDVLREKGIDGLKDWIASR